MVRAEESGRAATGARGVAPVRVRRVLRAAGGLALLGASACGPSFQAIYEGNARFEHCYALEENAQRPMRDKASCWRDWSERYTYGQTRDRIQYAIARYVALSQAPSLPTDEALMMAAPGEAPRVSAITAPAPTNAFAPPPKVLEAGPATAKPFTPASAPEPAVAAAGPEPAPPSLPASSCADGCSVTFRECNGRCEGGAASGDGCEACQKTYRACMRACYR